MLGISSFSDFLGYASITCWLGAQFPQVLENIRLQSVEGLALPFLANWLLGDVTNLVGCILTHQLPFQTYLAVYFCFVDLTLLGQYVYYRSLAKAAPSYLPVHPGRTSIAATRRMSIERAPARYRTLSNVAANVAAAAALAAQQEEQTRWHRASLESNTRSTLEPRGEEEELEDEGEVDEEALSRLANSFHSEGGRSRRKMVSWSGEQRAGSLGRSRQATMSPTGRIPPSLHMTSPLLGGTEDFDFASRGRSLSRGTHAEGEGEEWTSSSAQRRSSRASRKGASMVFLGVWALFGVGTLAGSGRWLPKDTGLRIGRVLGREEYAIPIVTEPIPNILGDISAAKVADHSPSLTYLEDVLNFTNSSNQPPEEHGPSTEYIIGRISAWICTTLYLTSRLPQIWKNFDRKSVEGLSMYLFIFAFLGNFFYVASILTSPKLGLPESEASAFLRESIPYLLGSGGTLMFDVTIVTQSFIYRPKAHIRGRRVSRTINEEEAGLLSAGATGAEDPITPSRRRLPTDGHTRD